MTNVIYLLKTSEEKMYVAKQMGSGSNSKEPYFMTSVPDFGLKCFRIKELYRELLEIANSSSFVNSIKLEPVLYEMKAEQMSFARPTIYDYENIIDNKNNELLEFIKNEIIMSLEIQQAKLNELLASTPEIPGLNKETILDNLVETKFKKELDSAKTPEDRKEIKDRMVEYYKNDGSEFIDNKVSDLKKSVSELTKGIAQVPIIISGIVVTAAVPTSTSAAVPMFASLLSFIDGLKNTCITLLNSANSLGFELPAPIFGLVASVEALYNLIPKKK